MHDDDFSQAALDTAQSNAQVFPTVNAEIVTSESVTSESVTSEVATSPTVNSPTATSPTANSETIVWKIQTLKIGVASLRYRCLFPVRYLNQRGVKSVLVEGGDAVTFVPKPKAIVFVKTFRDEDVEVCEQAYQLGVPIILDLCDNIFIDGYAAGNSYIPAKNFRRMAQRAQAIVTTGSAMKQEVEKASALSGLTVPVWVIPDGNETLDEIEYAFRSTRWQRVSRVVRRSSRKALRWLYLLLHIIRQKLQRMNPLRWNYGKRRRALKTVALKTKGKTGNVLRQYGLRSPLPPQTPTSQSPTSQSRTSRSITDSAPVPCQETLARDLTPREGACNRDRAVEPPATSAQPPSQPIAKTKVEPVPTRPAPWPQAATGVKTVLWFGNHGAAYGNFGMLNILDVADALTTVSQEQPLRLMVVSNSREKYAQHIAPLPFETDYLQWHPRKIYDYLRASDVVIIPNSQSIYSICKSANRAVLALSQGTPVVASRTPALDMLSGGVLLDDWEAGLRSYLLQPELAKAHVAKAQQLIQQHLSGDVIATRWLALLEEVT